MRRHAFIGTLLMALTTISALGCGNNDWLDRGPTKLALNGDPEGL